MFHLSALDMIYSYIFILTEKHSNSSYYVGITQDIRDALERRSLGKDSGYPNRFNNSRFVYFEAYLDRSLAEQRCEQLRAWRKEWKEKLIRSVNPEMKDISDRIGMRIEPMNHKEKADQ